MTVADDRYAITMRRRFRDIRDQFKLPALPMFKVNEIIERLRRLDDGGITDPDLRVVYRLAARGLFDKQEQSNAVD